MDHCVDTDHSDELSFKQENTKKKNIKGRRKDYKKREKEIEFTREKKKDHKKRERKINKALKRRKKHLNPITIPEPHILNVEKLKQQFNLLQYELLETKNKLNTIMLNLQTLQINTSKYLNQIIHTKIKNNQNDDHINSQTPKTPTNEPELQINIIEDSSSIFNKDIKKIKLDTKKKKLDTKKVKLDKVDVIENDNNIYISEKLANFLDINTSGNLEFVMKKIHQYIIKNNLQDPENKLNILFDQELKKIFKLKKNSKLTFFNLPKYVRRHFVN